MHYWKTFSYSTGTTESSHWIHIHERSRMVRVVYTHGKKERLTPHALASDSIRDIKKQWQSRANKSQDFTWKLMCRLFSVANPFGWCQDDEDKNILSLSLTLLCDRKSCVSPPRPPTLIYNPACGHYNYSCRISNRPACCIATVHPSFLQP